MQSSIRPSERKYHTQVKSECLGGLISHSVVQPWCSPICSCTDWLFPPEKHPACSSSLNHILSFIGSVVDNICAAFERWQAVRFVQKLEAKENLDVPKDPITTAKTLVSNLAKLGIVVLKKTISRILHRKGEERPSNLYLLGRFVKEE